MRGAVWSVLVGVAGGALSQGAVAQGVFGPVEVLHRAELPVRGNGPLGWELREVSAIEWIERYGVLLALGDDRSESGPARVAVIECRFDWQTGRPLIGDLSWRALTAPGGGGFARDTVDPEGLRVVELDGPAGVGGMLGRCVVAVASEGYAREGLSPAVFLMDLGGVSSRRWDAPASVAVGHPLRGIDHSRGFEALAVTGFGKAATLYAGVEEPLRQDRPDPQTNDEPGIVRVVVYRDGAAGVELGFPLGPGASDDEPGSHALAELLALEGVAERRLASPGMLALENAKGVDGSGRARLSWTTPMGATDLSGVVSLRDRGTGGLHLMPKVMLADFLDLGIDAGADDWEGMTLGPVVDGRRTLIVCEDNEAGPNRIVVLALPEGL